MVIYHLSLSYQPLTAFIIDILHKIENGACRPKYSCFLTLAHNYVIL